jgi:site-specific DNA-methyltransferase (cytosine-N4-specific)
MKRFMKDPKAFCRPKDRPSGHDIGGKFGDDNGGEISSNLLQYSNMESNSSTIAQ